MPNTPKVPEKEYRLRESYAATMLEMHETCERLGLNYMVELQSLAVSFNKKHKRKSKAKGKSK